MIDITNFIIEKLKINSKSKINQYNYFPNTSLQLRNILKERLSKDKNANLNDIDVSKITNMSNMFVKLDPHDINIENWDVSNVQNMADMFYDCGNFNCDLSKWDVRNVINMEFMFFYCANFKGIGLNNWNADKASLYMTDMFEGCKSISKLPKWYKNKK